MMVSKRSNEEVSDEKLEGREECGENGKVKEEALLALLEHRACEVEHLKKRISFYTSQLEEAEEKLRDTELKLAYIRGQSRGVDPDKNAYIENRVKRCKLEVPDLEDADVGILVSQPKPKAELAIPDIKPMLAHPISALPVPDNLVNVKEEVLEPSPIVIDDIEVSSEQSEDDLISHICCSTSSSNIRFRSSNYIPAQHKRRLRSLALCPENDKDFVTSSLDGVVNLWKIQAHGRWPEDIAWHPSRKSLFCAYTADSGESQVSVVDYNKKHARARVTFLTEKPHSKGVINTIAFMPWDNSVFVTGGNDHAVIMWHEKDNGSSWKTNSLHRNTHSSAVSGVAGLQHKKIVLSVGSDKRIVGFDLLAEMSDCRFQLDSKCMSVLPNPCDFNLVMVQTGSPEKQLRLFDFRLRNKEIYALGFKQESSESHSALISQSWSPSGWYLASGSVDPVIHIFDIRYNSARPSQSIRAHHKRVFKAAWHQTRSHIISISSDGNIGIHNIT